MRTHKLCVIAIFCAKHPVTQILLGCCPANAFQFNNMSLHFICGKFFDILLFEDSLQFIQQRDIFRVFGVEAAFQFPAGLFQHVLELVRNDHFVFRYLPEMELDLIQCHVQQSGCILTVLKVFLQIDECDAVIDLSIQRMEVLHAEPLCQFLIAEQLDDIRQFLVCIQCPADLNQFLLVIQCSDLL